MPKIKKENKFKNDAGAYILSGLFWETQVHARQDYCIYTFNNEDIELEDGRVLKSITKAYMDIADPTEYEFAIKYFDSWGHWNMIANSAGCREWIEKLRNELTVKLRSDAIKRIISHSEDDKGFQAAKWLADKGWDKKMGRPNKAQRKQQAKEDEDVHAAVAKDLENARIATN